MCLAASLCPCVVFVTWIRRQVELRDRRRRRRRPDMAGTDSPNVSLLTARPAESVVHRRGPTASARVRRQRTVRASRVRRVGSPHLGWRGRPASAARRGERDSHRHGDPRQSRQRSHGRRCGVAGLLRRPRTTGCPDRSDRARLADHRATIKTNRRRVEPDGLGGHGRRGVASG